jgi:hypothetical protein
MRDLVRTQLDLDDTDLPDPLLDAYLQEGYDRVLELEQRWPFFEMRWTLDVPANGETTMPDDSWFIEMLVDAKGRILPRIPARLSVMSYPPGNTANGTPMCWTRINWVVVVTPPPGSEMVMTVLGYRMGSDWIGIDGASGECDCDRRLHIPICWYAASAAYAQQEDEVLEATYMNRFKEGAAVARDAIMRAPPITPRQVAYTHYPTTTGGPGGPAQVVINATGP